MVRIKYRYFLTTLHYLDGELDTSLTSHHLLDALYNAIEENYGEFGLGNTQGRIKVIYLGLLTSTALIRVPADYEKQCRISLSTVVLLRGRRCVPHVIHVGGTIRTCQKELVKYNVNKLHRAMLDTQDQREREQIKEVLERTLGEINRLCT